MKHQGDLTITVANCKKFADLTEVTGYLYIGADASLPALTTVGGSLYIGADASLPALTTVGGSLDIGADASLPALTTVGRYLYIRAGKMTAPMLMVAHGEKGDLLAVSKYGLWRSAEGYYYAGCRGPLSKERALAHWNRTDERAVVFTTAIKVAS
ncbi:MAG: hypothetical protein M3Q12_01105 [Pseudomonadota bacterium]|nr:hypothetical protein [Pseudomonadota bacterium]